MNIYINILNLKYLFLGVVTDYETCSGSSGEFYSPDKRTEVIRITPKYFVSLCSPNINLKYFQYLRKSVFISTEQFFGKDVLQTREEKDVKKKIKNYKKIKPPFSCILGQISQSSGG